MGAASLGRVESEPTVAACRALGLGLYPIPPLLPLYDGVAMGEDGKAVKPGGFGSANWGGVPAVQGPPTAGDGQIPALLDRQVGPDSYPI